MQVEINHFIDENLPADTPLKRAKALKKLFQVIGNAESGNLNQSIKNNKLALFLDECADDILSKKTAEA